MGWSPSLRPTSAERTIVFWTAGTSSANPAEAFRRGGRGRVSHPEHRPHHDNTHFGTVNLVVDEASCTAEIVWTS